VTKTLLSCVLSQLNITPLFQISLSTLGYLFLTSNISFAQVTSDGTVNTQVNQNGNVAEITGGERAGDNLFHSFQDFSVGTGDTASFLNANDIANIFSRVTGGNISNIDGLIRANGSANLFLINPAGILFGENARLDVGGSFYGSTADSILFEDGEFSAVDNLQQPVLTINAPIGLGLRDNPGDIVNRSNFELTTRVIDGEDNPVFEGNEFTIREATGLEVSPQQTIALIGGNVILENAGAISAPGGQVELGGLSQPGEVSINTNGSLTFPEAVARGDVSLSDQARVRVAGDGGGSINVNARNLALDSQSELYAGIAEDAGSLEAQAGDITINATKSVRITGSGGIGEDTSNQANAFALLFNDYDTAIRNVVGFRPNQENIGLPNLGRNPKPESTVLGNAGSIIISTNLLEISDRGSLTAKVYGQGNTGDFNLQTNNIVIDRADVLNQIISGTGNPGDINITTNNLTVVGSEIDPEQFFNSDGNSSFILADSRSFGSSGDININAANDINFDGVNNIGTTVLPGGEGNAGNITINAGGSFTAQGSLFQSTHTGEVGNPGNITLDVEGDIILDRVLLNSQLSNQGTGTESGGNITLSASNLYLTGGSAIEADTQGLGNAGTIALNIDNEINFNIGSRIDARVSEEGTGNAGNIEITANSLSLNNESRFNAQTLGQGNAGDIKINTNVLFLTNGSEIRADTANNNDAGNIKIETNQLTINEGSQIATGTSGEGNAGDLTVRASEFIKLSGQSENQRSGLDANAIESSGNGGELTVNTEELTIEDGATITVGNFQTLDINEPGTGEAGNINIFANSVTLNDQGRIDAATQSEIGDGANINLTVADDIILENNSLISARAFNNADGGNLNIDTNFIVAFPSNGNGNDIIASAEQGQGGNITINAESLLGIAEGSAIEGNNSNDIDASSQVIGLDGTVTINTLDVNPVQGATELPSNVVEAEQTTEQACQANREAAAKNGLVINGKGGIPAPPDQPLTSQNLLINGEVTSASAIPEPIETSQGKIHLARGIKFTKDGGIILTPYPTNNAGERIPIIKRNCI
jgi:filamentous hemagglutinin family protein